MKRRSLLQAFALGTVAVISYPAYKWFSLKAKPDLLYFTDKESLLAELADTIIPATNTPGAKDAFVEKFIVKMLRDCTDIASQNNFITGLKNLEQYTASEFNKSFISCSNNQRETILRYFEEQSKRHEGIIGKIQNKILGKPFFSLLREYTVQGYCTSMLGATQGLAYEFIPGTFEPCVPLKPFQKSWATK